MKSALIFIKTNYAYLVSAIQLLEKRGITLVEAISAYKNVKHRMENVPGNFGEKILTKLKAVADKNPGLEHFLEVAKVHEGYAASVDVDIGKAVVLKYAPVTSCDVERSFSMYKDILSHKRQNLLPENIEKYLIVGWEMNQN